MAMSPIDASSPGRLAQLALGAARRSGEIDRGGHAAPGRPADSGDQKRVEQLERRDREVRAHEAAHKAAAGSLARGGPTFDTTPGPDGRRYAVGGEVQIDTSPVSGDPEATLRKAARIRAAALAPADPSPQDRRVAADAAALARQAQSELAAERTHTDATARDGGDGAGDPRPKGASDARSAPAEVPPDVRPGQRIDLRA